MSYYVPSNGRNSLQLEIAKSQQLGSENYADEVEQYLAFEAEKEELVRISQGLSPREPVSGGKQGKARRFLRLDTVKDYTKGEKKRGGPSVTVMTTEAKEKLIKDVLEGEMDNLLGLQKVHARFKNIGLELPAVEIHFKNLTVSAEVYVGSRSVPTLWNALRSLGENVTDPIMKILHTKKSEKKTMVMVDNISGVLKPGRVTLLLGPPGAGKSTLLRVLAGQMKDKDVKVTGEVCYNGVPVKDKSFVVERTGAYIDQVDSHIAEMTVRETMAFSARMIGQGSGNDTTLEYVVAKEKKMGVTPDPQIEAVSEQLLHGSKGDNIVVDIMSNLLGLGVCIDTVIGNDLLKGISGGQKKRVTTGEMAVGRLPVMMMDEISTGLDSASTCLISKSLRNLSHLLRTNIVVALLQPSPETYDVFDDIILMGEGKILYHGPKEGVEVFTSSLGLTRPPRKAVADFLQEITSKTDQKAYLSDQSKGYMSCTDISKAFQASSEGQARGKEVATPAKPTELDLHKMMKHQYALGFFGMVKHLLIRELLLMLRQKEFIIMRALQTTVLAFAAGTMFVNQAKDTVTDANYFMSVCFFSAMNMLLGGFAETPIFVLRLPIYYKQRNYHFFNAWSYCLSGALVRVPDNVLMVTLWTLMVYWCVGFTATAGQFFIFWFILVCTYTFSTSIFRTIASVTRHQVMAQAVGSAMLVLCINTSGFTLNRAAIPPWWIWVYWMNPMAYAIRALLVNEMNTDDWSTAVQPAGPESAISLGMFAMENRSFQTETWWVWVAVGVLLGASFLLILLQAHFLHTLDGLKGDAAISEEEEEEPQPKALSGDAEEGGVTTKNTSLSFTPFMLAFREIKYHVPKPAGKAGEELTLLKGIDGCFSPGVLTALMGASGAGKTTLMDVLAGRKTGGRMEGDITLNGHLKVQSTFARVMGYVEQFDIHCSQATVHEALLFSGRMRLSGDLGDETTIKFVDEVMDLVEMRPLANALIGQPGVNGLSVEQRKRLTIAVELVANPSVVFMDEPTSGLDARAAAIVMRTVRNTVNTGRTVVCTIHQPSLDIFQTFDELLLLKRGGETIFFGNMGEDQVNLIDHFESVPGVEKFQPGYNPANWMLEVSSPGAELDLGVDFAAVYKTSKAAEKCKAKLDEVCSPAEGSTPLHFDTQFAVGTISQFKLILTRNLTSYWRSPNYNFVRMMITMFIGLVFGSLYWDIGMKRDSQVAVLNIMGCLYGSTTFLGVANAMIVLPVIHGERVVFYREKASGMFGPLAFAIAQGIVEVPYLIFQATIYVLTIYWMVGFEASVAKFFWYWLFNFQFLTIMSFFGIMAINLTPAPEFGTVFTAFFFTLWNLTCGFLIPQPDIHPWWIWMYWGQPISYTLYGLCASQLGDVYDTHVNVAQPGAPAENITVAEFVEQNYGFRHDFIGWCAFILVAFTMCFRWVAIIALHKLNFQKR